MVEDNWTARSTGVSAAAPCAQASSRTIASQRLTFMMAEDGVDISGVGESLYR